MPTNQEKFNKLNQKTKKPSISIFIPTAQAGKEVHNEKNKTQLKSLWDQVKRDAGMDVFSKDQIEEFDSQIDQLLADKDFWHHQSDGLSVFLKEGFFEYYRLRISFEAFYRISDSFYITPLIPIFSAESPFYLLALQLEDVHLYEANEHSISEVEIDELTPSRLEDRVGYDYKEKNLQFRNMDDVQGNTQYHGHGGGERDETAEIRNYFSAIDKGLQSFLNNKNAPLVLMCQENLFPIYRETNSYDHLYAKPVAENPADKNMLALHREASRVMEDYFEKTKREKMKVYEESGPETKSSVVHDIIPAAFEGRIDTLFIEKNEELWGQYDKKSRKVSVHGSRKKDSTSLLNLTAKKVLEDDGKVFLLKHTFMPEKEAKMNAVFRY